MTLGRRSIVPFHTARAVSYSAWSGAISSPRNPSISIVAASSPTGRPACSPACHRCSTASAHHRGPRLWSQESGLPSRGRGRDSGTVRTYGQYCPIARGAEIFAERWTPLIIRNLHLGCGTFSEILEGAPGSPRTLLSQRLKHRAAGHRRVGSQARRAGPLLRAHTRGSRPVRGLHVARRVGRPLARDRPSTSTLRGPVVDVQGAPPGPSPARASRHPLRLHGSRAPRAVLADHRAR